MDNLNEEIKKEKTSKSNLVLNIILIICFFLISSYYVFSAPKREKDIIIHVSSNDTLTKLSDELENKKVVRYSSLLKTFVYVFSGDGHLVGGDYLFKKDKSLFSIAWQISRGRHDVKKLRVTFTEGMTNEDMAKILSNNILTFRKDLFLSDPRSKQGYLFPVTYFFFPQSTTDEILKEMTTNFKKKIGSLDGDIKSSGRDLSDIITMASILEKEAAGKDDAPIISGILWKRIKLGMPLQVDAAPTTYKKDGLPEAPISNPGLSTIKEAMNPTDSPYLFYLHDNNGQVHFALDFSEHRSNIARYLK